jgi:hypothetical protein
MQPFLQLPGVAIVMPGSAHGFDHIGIIDLHNFPPLSLNSKNVGATGFEPATPRPPAECAT